LRQHNIKLEAKKDSTREKSRGWRRERLTKNKVEYIKIQAREEGSGRRSPNDVLGRRRPAKKTSPPVVDRLERVDGRQKTRSTQEQGKRGEGEERGKKEALRGNYTPVNHGRWHGKEKEDELERG